MNIELVYHFVVVSMSLILLWLKWTVSHSPIMEIFIKILGKVIPLFALAYAIVQIFKFYHILN